MARSVSYSGDIPPAIWILIFAIISFFIGYLGEVPIFKFVGWTLFILFVAGVLFDWFG